MNGKLDRGPRGSASGALLSKRPGRWPPVRRRVSGCKRGGEGSVAPGLTETQAIAAVDDEGGPLISHSASDDQQQSFDSTCRKFHRFLKDGAHRG